LANDVDAVNQYAAVMYAPTTIGTELALGAPTGSP
jgi:hypothetical protein